MYIHEVPNRQSRPTILLREGYRENGKVKNRTLANITHWSKARIEALKKTLKGEFDGLAGPAVSDKIFGVLFILKELALQIGIVKALGRSLMAKFALFLILARVAHQGSRLSAVRWAQNHAVAEILSTPDFDENDLYTALDWLADRQESIENKLYQTYLKKNGGPPTLVLYDVTSSYLEGDKNELGEYGHNRDGKKGKRQIVIGLLTADDGEPLSVKVFKGNTSDLKTLTDQIETVKKRFKVPEVVFVGDRGMIKSKGKKELKESNFRYITALTDPQVRKLLNKEVIQLSLFDEPITEVEYGHERLILKRNPAVAYKEAARREDKLAKLKTLIEERNDFVKQSKRAKPEAGLKKFTNWVKRYKLSSFVRLELDGREIKIKIDETDMEEDALLDGCYVLTTDVSKEKMDAVTIDARYRDLQKVERHFRMIKTSLLEIRPIFVRKGKRTRGHVFVAMLALKLSREMDIRLKKSFGTVGQKSEAVTVDDVLEHMTRLCFRKQIIEREDILTLPLPDEKQKAIFSALSIKPPLKN